MITLLGLALLASSISELGPIPKLPLADQTAPTPPAPETPPPMEESTSCYGSFILNEFKIAYFRPGDEKIRHMYDKGLLDLQLSSSFYFYDPFYIYGSVEYISADGRRREDHKKTHLRMVPVSLGLQYIQKIVSDFKYYITLGPRVFFFHQWNHNGGGDHTNRCSLGGFANTGFLYYLNEHVVVDFFGEYSYDRIKTSVGSTQIGGLTFGAGIGYFW